MLLFHLLVFVFLPRSPLAPDDLVDQGFVLEAGSHEDPLVVGDAVPVSLFFCYPCLHLFFRLSLNSVFGLLAQGIFIWGLELLREFLLLPLLLGI